MKKLVEILRSLFGAAKTGDLGALLDVAGEARELVEAFADLASLDDEARRVVLEGRDVLVHMVPVLALYAQGYEPTKAQKDNLRRELAEFIHAAGALIDALPTRD